MVESQITTESAGIEPKIDAVVKAQAPSWRRLTIDLPKWSQPTTADKIQQALRLRILNKFNDAETLLRSTLAEE